MRYIDADALAEKLGLLMERYAAQGRMEVAEDYNWARTVLDVAPAADVAPVVHARWIQINRIATGRDWKYRCSECGCPQDYEHNYCPNCGAKMDGEESYEKKT